MIVGLAGAKHSGKNTVANYVSDIYGHDYEVVHWSFAEDLKISAMNALGGTNYSADDAVAYADIFKEEGYLIVGLEDGPSDKKSGREYLQWYGTEAHRDVFGDDFWVDNLLDKILEDCQGSAYEDRLDLITDCRFPNEAVAIHENMGPVVRINRPEVESSGDTHASEKPLEDHLIDYNLYNEGTLDDLYNETIRVFDVIIRDNF